MMAENGNHIQLIRTKEWVPRPEAEKQAKIVYEHFTQYNPQASDSLSHLALAVCMGFDQQQQTRLYDSVYSDWLNDNNYYSKLLTYPELILTVRGKVAVNMVVPELDGGNLYSYLDEPLVGVELLAGFYQNLNK